MQVHKKNTYLERVLLSTVKAYTRYFESRESYKNVKKIFSINLVNHILFYNEEKKPDRNYYNFGVRDEIDSDLKIESFNIIFIELPRFKSEFYTKENEKRLKLWQSFFTAYNYNTRQFDLHEEVFKDELISEVMEKCRLRLTGQFGNYYTEYKLAVEKNQRLIDKNIELKNELDKKDKEYLEIFEMNTKIIDMVPDSLNKIYEIFKKNPELSEKYPNLKRRINLIDK